MKLQDAQLLYPHILGALDSFAAEMNDTDAERLYVHLIIALEREVQQRRSRP